MLLLLRCGIPWCFDGCGTSRRTRPEFEVHVSGLELLPLERRSAGLEREIQPVRGAGFLLRDDLKPAPEGAGNSRREGGWAPSMPRFQAGGASPEEADRARSRVQAAAANTRPLATTTGIAPMMVP
jgi:hypothetical protein